MLQLLAVTARCVEYMGLLALGLGKAKGNVRLREMLLAGDLALAGLLLLDLLTLLDLCVSRTPCLTVNGPL